MECQDCLEYIFFAAIILLAMLHGLVLAFIFLFNKRLNSKSNKFLAISLLGICVILGYECAYWLDVEEYIPMWVQYLPLYIRTTLPVGVFYFVVFLIQPKHQLTKFEKLGFVVIAIEVFIELLHISINLIFQEEVLIEIVEHYIFIAGWFLGIFTSLALVPWAFYRVNQYQKFLNSNYSTTSGKNLRWLSNFLVLALITILIGVVSFIQYIVGYWDASELTFAIVTLCFVVILFWTGYFVILRYHWFEIVPLKDTKVVENLTGSKLSSKTDAYHHSLINLMVDEKLFENIDLNLDNLSDRLQISSGYLSQIIKEKEQKNFFEFINAYRVQAVKEKLLDKEYQNYTIMGIALESGFNSKSTFNSVFKKFTGNTPSAFKKNYSIKEVQLS